MKSFKSYLKEYGALDPFQPMGGNSSGPGMGQYVPSADLNLRASRTKQAVSGGKVAKFVTGHNVTFQGKKYKKVELEVLKVDNKSKTVEVAFISPKELENKKVNMPFRFLRRGPFVATKIPNYFEEKNPRIPRKKGQPAGSDKHSDLYTDENPKGTIHGLKFATVKDAEESVRKIKNSDKKHAHKIQAAIAMEQRAREMGKISAADVYRAYIEKMKKKTKEMQKEDFLITEKFGVVANQSKLSEIIFQGSHKAKEGKEVDNMYIPMSSALFKRVFPKQVRVRTFHVTSPDGFERLYDIQNSTKSISTFANMSSRNISGGIAEGSGVVAEIDGNALVSSSQDLFSVPIKDGRRLISYGWLRGKWGERNLTKMDKDMTVLLKALIKKYAPERAKKRTSPYFTDFEVWKSVRASYEWHKNEPDKKVQREAGKKMQKIIKDYLDGVERVLKKNATQVQEILTNYLKTRRTEDNWDEIIVDDVNILKVFIISDHEETAIFKKDQLDHEAYKKMLDYTKLPVKIVNSVEMERYVLGVAEKELKKMMEERNYKKEYANYQGKPEQIARRSSRNKARRLMGDKDIKGKDIGHKDNNPLNNDPKNLKIEDPSKNRREPRLRGQSVVERLKQSDVEGLEKFADRLLKKYKIDIEFTKHFVDRLNDPRNDPEIKVAELQRLFKKIKKNKGIGILSSPDIEAVLKDMETNLNLPVVIKKKGNEFEVLNKTIMRKPNFKTTSKVIRYENAPDTSDAMKRYKAGKAGFTDIAHLKAKGLIARSDGEKKKSAKYK